LKKLLFILLFILWLPKTWAQTETPVNTEQQLENQTQGNDDAETEDDSYLQQLEQYKRSRLNLNTITDEELSDFQFLSQLQKQSFLSYRRVLGKFLSIYEIQAIPTWDLDVIQKMLPYVYVGNALAFGEDMAQRFTNGRYSLLGRVQQVLEESKGFAITDTNKTRYLGSPQRILFRFKYQYRNLLQFGVVGDKDAGEQFFKGAQSQGFDFYSFHLFARNIGIIKSLAIGDFTLNMGQGLIQYQSQAFKKGPDVLGIKRQAAILRPYSSVAEFSFHRGVGITIGKGNWSATAFFSSRYVNANLNSDTSQTAEDFFSSFLTSGYNRTKNEIADRNKLQQTTFGGNISFQNDKLHVGINAISYKFSSPLKTATATYNLYDLKGDKLTNISFDYSYTWRNLHFFGETATDHLSNMATTNGLLVSLSNQVDASLLYRNISPQFQALYANAFTESTTPNNESGLFFGLSIKPVAAWRIDAYADAYQFPWVRYRVDAPTTGGDYLVQATYKPNKIFELVMRLRSESKAINISNTNLPFHVPDARPRQSFRLQFSQKLDQQFTVRGRTEMVWVQTPFTNAKETGFLAYFDCIYKPLSSKLSANCRVQYFETDSYDSRIYAYENDVLYGFSIPAFYGKGYRYYLNLNYDISKKLTTWFRIAQTVQVGQTTIGSGLDEIQSNHKTDFRWQFLYNF
jgi:uncharacterized protein YjiS (DUF1127 family)